MGFFRFRGFGAAFPGPTVEELANGGGEGERDEGGEESGEEGAEAGADDGGELSGEGGARAQRSTASWTAASRSNSSPIWMGLPNIAENAVIPGSIG